MSRGHFQLDLCIFGNYFLFTNYAAIAPWVDSRHDHDNTKADWFGPNLPFNHLAASDVCACYRLLAFGLELYIHSSSISALGTLRGSSNGSNAFLQVHGITYQVILLSVLRYDDAVLLLFSSQNPHF